MRKMMLVLFAVLSVLATMPEMAEAQRYYCPTPGRCYPNDQIGRRVGGGYNNRVVRGGRYGYYDPATIEQMISMPDGLVACQVDFATATVSSCHSVVKTADAIQMFSQNPDGILGSVHVEKGQFHFRPFDDTNARIGTGTGGVLGGAGGAAIGGAYGGRKGAAIGGVAGAITGGILGSRRSHNNCLKVEPQVAQASGLTQQITSASTPVAQVTEPSKASVNSSAGLTWLTINTTDFRAVITDPNTGEEKLVPAGGSINLPEPEGQQPYQVVLLSPGRGNIERVPGEIRPSQDLQGWEIWAR